jgi:hypothetical protein
MSEKFRTRPNAADYCKSRGIPVSPKTLQKMATVGGGPVYRIFGNRALYTEADLDSWIAEKLSAPRRSTSEAA